jgi:hypothetical protein
MASFTPARIATFILATAVVLSAQPQQTVNTNLGKDANGNSLRLAVKTGHVSNYDEDKVKPYTLPDPLVFASGARVTDAAAWKQRREEVIRIYETEIFGRCRSAERSPAIRPTRCSSAEGSATVRTRRE